MGINFDIDTTGDVIKVVIGLHIEAIGINFNVYKDKNNKFRVTANMTKAICEKAEYSCNSKSRIQNFGNRSSGTRKSPFCA